MKQQEKPQLSILQAQHPAQGGAHGSQAPGPLTEPSERVFISDYNHQIP